MLLSFTVSTSREAKRINTCFPVVFDTVRYFGDVFFLAQVDFMGGTFCFNCEMFVFRLSCFLLQLSPAQSRQFNQDCALLQFYDYHDIWHFLSAIGMFFTFMVLLTLDDDLSHTHRGSIYVF